MPKFFDAPELQTRTYTQGDSDGNSLFYIYASCEKRLLLWPPCIADADFVFCPVVSSFFFLLSFSSPNLSRRRLDVYHTSSHLCGLSANLGCRSEMYYMRLAEIQDANNRQKFAIWAPSHNFVGLYLRN